MKQIRFEIGDDDDGILRQLGRQGVGCLVISDSKGDGSGEFRIRSFTIFIDDQPDIFYTMHDPAHLEHGAMSALDMAAFKRDDLEVVYV